jgi:uncharacterized protein YkwD
MHAGRLAVAALFGALLALPLAPTPALADWDSETAAFLTILNNYRQSRGLQPVTVDSRLQQTADWHAHNQVVDAKCLDQGGPSCSHTDTQGRLPSARGQSFGYIQAVSENMMWPTPSPQQAFVNWQNSEGHHANMINPAARAIGISRVCKEERRCYWVTNFGSELSQAFAAPPIALPQASWTGTWTMGDRVMVLTQAGDRVTGTFLLPVPRGKAFEAGSPGKVEGTVLPGTAKILGTWTQPDGFADEKTVGGTVELTMALNGNTLNGAFTYPSPDRPPGWTRDHAVTATRSANPPAAQPQPQAQPAPVTQPQPQAQPATETQPAPTDDQEPVNDVPVTDEE